MRKQTKGISFARWSRSRSAWKKKLWIFGHEAEIEQKLFCSGGNRKISPGKNLGGYHKGAKALIILNEWSVPFGALMDGGTHRKRSMKRGIRQQ